MGILVSGYLLIEEGKEVPHHYKDRPGQGQEELADVKSALIEIIDSCGQKRTWSGSFLLPHSTHSATGPNFTCEHKQSRTLG